MRINIINAFKLRTYRVLAIGNTVSMHGVWIQKVAAGWLAWDLSHSTVWLGLVTAADLVPAIALSSYFGALADKYDKVMLLRIAQVAAITEALVVAALVFTHAITVEVLLGLTLLLGVANSVDQPSRLSLLREVLPAEHIPAAVTFNSLSFNVARFVGPMIAGLTIAVADIGYAFLVTAAALAWFLSGLLTLPVGKTTPASAAPGFLGDIIDGFRHVGRHAALRQTMIIVFLFGMTVGGMNQLLPALADRVFGRGVDGFVELTVSAGLGAVAAGVLVFFLPERSSPLISQPVCFALAAVALAALSLTDHYAIGFGCLFMTTFASTQSSIQAQSAINQHALPGTLGRVMGIYGAVVRGAPALGGFGIGFFAAIVPFGPIIAGCAGIMGLYGFWLWRLRRANAPAAKRFNR